LAELRDRGIHGGVMLMPMVPGYCDTEDNIDEVVKRSKESKAEYVLYASMTMREEQRDRMFSMLEASHPELVKTYEELYKGQHWPHDNYIYDVNLKAHSICKKRSMPERVARYVPEGAIVNNLKVCEILCNTAFFMQLKNVFYDKVKAYRRAGRSVDVLEEDIRTINEEGRLLDVPGVGKVISKDIVQILEKGTSQLYEDMKK
jgi:hypothetical protein